MAEDRFRDCFVSVDCGSEGLYQGEIEKLDSKVGELTLKKATRNGVPEPNSRVKIAASRIEDIRAYKKMGSVGGRTSTVVTGLPAKSGLSAGSHHSHTATETCRDGEFRGCLVSVDCDELGYYQGKVIDVDAVKKTITLEATLKNGIPVKAKNVVLSAEDIADIKVVRMADCEDKETTKAKAKSHAEERQYNPSSTSSSSPPASKASSKAKPPKDSKTVAQPIASTKLAIQSKNKKENKKEPVRDARPQITIMKRAPAAKTTNQSYSQFSPGKKGGRHVPDGPTGIPSLDMANCKLQRPQPRPQDQAVGPSGIPSVDCANGYTSRHPGGGLLEEPLDHSLLQKDFDFDAMEPLQRLESSDDERTQDDKESSSD